MHFSFLAMATTQNALWALCLAVGAGCILTVLSRRLHLPTIVLLLIGGFALGAEGTGWLQPDALGDLLPMIVSLAVGLILFEGGLTLDIKEFKKTSTVIKRLLTIGVLITWLGAGLTAYVIFDISPSFALLMGSLIIVTGPTVIVPLLRRIRVQQKLGSILHWEGVLIDSIGVFTAILCFEWVVEGGGAVALPNFLIRIVSGAGIGLLGGYLIYWVMKKNWVPDNIVNAFALASAMLIFGATELIKPEAGLLSVTIAGLIVGIKKPRQLREIKAFKAEIVDLLIGMLFLLLVARLELQQFVDFFEMGGGWVLFSVILLIRPISITVSSWGTPLNLREKALLSWVAPRGVVAASMASLFAISLNSKETLVGDPALLESFVYSVICATVLIQGLSAGLVAKALRLQRPAPNDWIIIGAHHFGRELARKLMRKDEQYVLLLDTNARNIALAQKEGLPAMHCDGMEAEKLYENEQALFGAGYVLALTDNIELNELLMQRWGEELANEKVFGWIPTDAPSSDDRLVGQSVFGDLSRPAVIGSELMQGESDFEVVVWEEGKSLPSGDWHPLFIRRGKQLRAIPQDSSLKEMVKDEDEVICLRRSEGFLLRALQSGGFLRLECETLDALYEQLARVAVEQVEALSEEKILEDLGAQGRIFPAFIGHGIAIPHVYCEDLDYRICFVAQLTNPLEIPGQDEAIDFVFFLLSPTGDSEGHLATLADIAKTSRSDRLRKQIKHAKSVDDVITAISG
ncbi:MAG: cation:proton antiporter [Opitutales bacterium]|jgi:NhaP-type Na+/H+ or K+/H+ antiporter/mannitol/fructose-specific phosphotransferase system IIA component (Ntr-type)|nr:cation:proton antiporter [Opitutales bacterium]MDP4643438.1 cation:proton antiporter [Opitutales bacterium]MDP5079076.1 cation:proton antiporter [Opitutales bacterium]